MFCTSMSCIKMQRIKRYQGIHITLRVLINLPCLSPKMNTHTKPYHYGMRLSAMDWNEHFDRDVTSHNDRVLSITGSVVELGS